MRNKVIIGSIIILIALGAFVMLIFNNKVFSPEENPTKPTEISAQTSSAAKNSQIISNTEAESEFIETIIIMVNGRRCPYDEIERPEKLTEEMFEKIELGTNFGDIENRFGRVNGSTSFNVNFANVYYKIDENKFIMLHFDGPSPYADEDTHLIGMALYDSEGLIRVIKGDMGE